MTETVVEKRHRLLRNEIGRIAVKLFADRGFDNVTVADLAEAAEISQRTFFRYFESKDAVVLDYERHVQDRLVAALMARPGREGPVEALRQAYLETSHVDAADRARVVQLGRILAEAPALRARANGERLASDDALITELSRRLRGPDADLCARVAVTAMGAVAAVEFRKWALDGGADDPAERIGRALQLLEDGLRHISNTNK